MNATTTTKTAKTNVKTAPKKASAKKPAEAKKPAVVQVPVVPTVPAPENNGNVVLAPVETDRHLYDTYAQVFKTFEGLVDDVKDMEAHSRWMPGMQSKEIKVFPIEAPLFAEAVAEKTGMDPDMCSYTSTDGSKLYLELPDGSTKLLSLCGMDTLCGRACLFGSALGRMTPPALAETLNLALDVATGDALVLERYGKIAALHSDAAGGYCVMPISALLRIVVRETSARCGSMKFLEGYNSHSYTTAIWALPDIKDKLVMKYREALLKSPFKTYMNIIDTATPVIRFHSSDTATSSATIRPMFKVGNGYVQLVDDIAVKHTKRVSASSKDGLSLFEEEVSNNLYSRLFMAVENLSALTEIEIQHPANVIIGICNKFRIPKKYGNLALEQTWISELNGESISAHDVFLLLNQAIGEAKDSSTTFDLGEKLCVLANPHFDWAAYDVGGTVAWAN